tara:strand:+ start:382 stop:753 length:372 start_codon:yes stop_codon:yes gene_type:complete
MFIRPKSLTLRIRLDDIISDGREVQILENLRYCKTMLGSAFDVTLWHEDVEEKELKRFIKEHQEIMFVLSTTITGEQGTSCWFLIDGSNTDKSRHRFKWHGDILTGIVEYQKMVKHLLKKEQD